MLGSTGLIAAIAVLTMLSVGSIAYVILAGRIRDENQIENRLAGLQAKSMAVAAAGRTSDATKRRKTIQETLEEMERNQKARQKRTDSPPLMLRLQQAGLNWTRRTFVVISIVAALVIGVIAFFAGLPLYAVAAATIGAGLGLPRWIVGRLRKRRFKLFMAEFPNAVDVIVRGIKSGLPVGDCLRIIATEAKEPVRSEFRLIVDEQQGLGLPLAEAVARLPERVPVTEANFFAIVIAIQQRAGGNLSEALGNLSRVLRERAKMSGKIQAMSMEAKASAWIIGVLPVGVMAVTFVSSPKYIMLLFTEPLGNVILGCSAVWMLIGILVMRKMIDFKI
ncbi:type II secretion system F family protein [Mesorhizobium sp. BR1-1-16]|uniref:type II secretion system F family protein n=1 Tax=Mesorhizobium sp. BR1-1-16 TaxID=2876653 RepID=UPI001CCC1494|nr:type II secretion system F family protein [Mesorhizobium sp. BR1-1-16]MBZ9938519.1 type II secretion system F family protein [Mesorhizobium sp. BR1-1-16]